MKVEKVVDVLARECTLLEGIFYGIQQRKVFVLECHMVFTQPPSEGTIVVSEQQSDCLKAFN